MSDSAAPACDKLSPVRRCDRWIAHQAFLDQGAFLAYTLIEHIAVLEAAEQNRSGCGVLTRSTSSSSPSSSLLLPSLHCHPHRSNSADMGDSWEREWEWEWKLELEMGMEMGMG